MENEIILYTDENGKTNVSVRFADEDVWATQAQLAEIYNTTQQNISLHIDNILDAGQRKDALDLKGLEIADLVQICEEQVKPRPKAADSGAAAVGEQKISAEHGKTRSLVLAKSVGKQKRRVQADVLKASCRGEGTVL